MLAPNCTTGAFSNMSAVHTEVCEWLCGGRNSLLAAQARGLDFDFLQLPHFSQLNSNDAGVMQTVVTYFWLYLPNCNTIVRQLRFSNSFEYSI